MLKIPYVIAILIFAVLAGSRPVIADEPPPEKVVFASMASCCKKIAWPEAEEAFIEELRTLNISLVTVDSTAPSGTPPALQYQRMQQEHHADIVVRFWFTPGGELQLDIVSWKHGKVDATRQLLFSGSRTPEDLETLLLSGIEALRVVTISFLPQAPSPPLPKKKRPTPAPKPRVMNTMVGGGVAFSPGGIGAVVGFSWAFTLNPVSPLLLEIDGLWAPFAGKMRNDYDDMSFDTLLARGFIYGNMFAKRRVGLALGIGGGACIAWISRAEKGDMDKVAYLGGAGRLRVTLTPAVGIVLSMKTGILLPRIEVVVDSATVATWGRPVIDAGLMLEIGF